MRNSCTEYAYENRVSWHMRGKGGDILACLVCQQGILSWYLREEKILEPHMIGANSGVQALVSTCLFYEF
ncbi:hypothetical protein FKM82_020155 [Ascaphus truei]